jgi:hypothetical protein
MNKIFLLLLLLTPVFLVASADRTSPIIRLARFTVVPVYQDHFDCDPSMLNKYQLAVLKDPTGEKCKSLVEQNLEHMINKKAQLYFKSEELRLKNEGSEVK